MAKIELFKNKFFGALIRALGAFPVERGAGDGKAIKTGEDLIRDGEIMTIFIDCTVDAEAESCRISLFYTQLNPAPSFF